MSDDPTARAAAYASSESKAWAKTFKVERKLETVEWLLQKWANCNDWALARASHKLLRILTEVKP